MAFTYNFRQYTGNYSSRKKVTGVAGKALGFDATGAIAAVTDTTASATDAITAFAGGGQGSATQLTSGINRVTVVGTAGDSVKLPAATAGARYVVINTSANSLNVFPATGETIVVR